MINIYEIILVTVVKIAIFLILEIFFVESINDIEYNQQFD